MDWRERHAGKRATLAQAISRIPRGRSIFVGSGAAEPVGLVEELVAQHERFSDNRVFHLMTLGPAPYADPRYRDNFRHQAFFIGANVRSAVQDGRADYLPVFLSQIPGLIRTRRTPIDVALIQCTPPDRFGFVNLGIAVDVVLAAIEAASVVLAEINPQMPTIHGGGFVSMDRIDAWVERDVPLPVIERAPLDETALQIGRNVAELVENGSTLQVGIGEVPDAVLASLSGHEDLGVWTEMLTDGVIDLMENGNVTGRFKTIDPRVVTASFTFGAKRTYDFVDRNPAVAFHPSDHVNDPINVARQHKMVAINAALQIDLTGQVCADSIGTKFYSGIGGQVDFIRGASMCPEGKPIIAVRSTARGGEISRIVATLEEGAGVVTSRGDVRYVVTEYGAVDLLGKSVRQRALALISIAHPDHRSALLDAAKHRKYVFPDQVEPRTVVAHEHERTLTLADGRSVLLRPIREVDDDKMQDLFYHLSERTRYQRWLTAKIRLHHRDLQRYLAVDDVHNVAIVAEYDPEDGESILVGIGRYHTDPADGFAEVALVVRDDWQGLGLGSATLAHLSSIARLHGIAGFKAEILADNHAMRHVFDKLGVPMQSRLDGGQYSVRAPFDPTASLAARPS